jgi:phenylacetate-coenzyme A ligase PaaK-like adenylate-forming protein
MTKNNEEELMRLNLVRATLRHAVEHVRYYNEKFSGLSLEVDSLEELRHFPLLSRETLAKYGTDLLTEHVVPEYVGITSGTTFGESCREPLLHYQTESEHCAWRDLYASMMTENVESERPLMLRLIDRDRGVEIAGAFPGCFSLPMENLYHFDLILSIMRREWSFQGFSKRIMSLSGPLETLQLITLLCMERHIDPAEFRIRLISSSGWQITSRWRRLFECYWGAEVQDVYGLAEAPGMFAVQCLLCKRFHFSPLSVIEVLHLDCDAPVTAGVGRVVVTCLAPIAHAQPIIRYDTNDVIDIAGECDTHRVGFKYLGRRSKLVMVEGKNGPSLVLSPLIVTEVLDSLPDVAIYENAKAATFGLQVAFGWPRYLLRCENEQARICVYLKVELRWSPMQYIDSAVELRNLLMRKLFDASPELLASIERGSVYFDIKFVEPGTMT